MRDKNSLRSVAKKPANICVEISVEYYAEAAAKKYIQRCL